MTERVKVTTWFESIVKGCLTNIFGFFLLAFVVALVVAGVHWVWHLFF